MSASDRFKKAGAASRFSSALAKDQSEAVRPSADAAAEINQSLGPTGKESVLSDVAAAAQTGSLGGGDQLAGLLSLLKGKGYGKGQREAEQSLKLAQENSPIASAAGALPMMAVGAAPTALGRIGLQGLVGATSGALSSPGDASAMDTIKDAGGDGATSALVGGAFEGATRLARPLLKGMAEMRATRAIGAQKADFRKMAEASPDTDPNAKARGLGRMILNLRRGKRGEGGPMLGYFSSAEGMAKRLGDSKLKTGMELGGMKDMAQDQLEKTAAFEVHKRPVRLEAIRAKLQKQSDEALRGGEADLAAALKSEADDIQRVMDARLEAGDYINLKLPESEAIKSKLQDALKKNYGKMQGPAIEARKATAGAYRAAGDDAFESIAGPSEADAFKNLKERYGKLAELSKIAKGGVVSDAARMPMGLTEQNSALLAAGTGGAPVEQLLKAGVSAGGMRLVRGRGDAFAARALDDLSTPTGKLGRSLAADEGTRRKIEDWLNEQGPSDEEQRRRYLELLSKGR